jgi:diadenosine tetraphosphatase ApaH/serine/threonine PP2A family protein phosphatase
MRIAIISDIHSNFEALASAISQIDALYVDEIFCLGDIIGYGPYPNECMNLVRERCTAVVKGNHDSGLTGETPLAHFNQYGRSAITWTQKQISGDNLKYLKELPLVSVQDDVTLVHASPLKPEMWTYVIAWPDAQECFKAFETSLCFIGHTHVPVIVGEDSSINSFRKGSRYLINVGSIGQPRDGNPYASFGLLDTEKWIYENIRVAYDVEKTADAISRAKLPEFLGKRLFLGI